MKSVEGRGEFLLLGRVWKKISGQLPGDELIVGKVFCKGIDHPISPGPNVHLDIGLVTESVGVSGYIEPKVCHAFRVSLGVQEFIDDPAFVGCRWVSRQRFDVFEARRESCKVQASASEPDQRVGLGGWSKTSIEQLAKYETIDRGLVPSREFRIEIGFEQGDVFEVLASQVRRVGRWNDRNVSPVGLVGCPLSDPLCDQVALFLGDRLACFGRRHDRIWVVRDDAFEDRACLWVSRKDGVCIEGCLAIVESQVGLARVGIRTMASEAGIREDGANISIEFDGRWGFEGRGWQDRCQCDRQEREESKELGAARIGRVRENHDLVWGGQVVSISGFDARIGDYSSTMSQSGTYEPIFPRGSWLFGSGSPAEILAFW